MSFERSDYEPYQGTWGYNEIPCGGRVIHKEDVHEVLPPREGDPPGMKRFGRVVGETVRTGVVLGRRLDTMSRWGKFCVRFDDTGEEELEVMGQSLRHLHADRN